MACGPASRPDRADAATALAGLIAALAATPVMLWLAAGGTSLQLLSAAVFCLSLVALHAASTLYHVARDPQRKARLKVFDHCAIYLLIAGTYTPFALLALHGPVGMRLLIAVWALAALGIVFKLFYTGRLRIVSTLLYVAMGWLVVFEWRPVLAALDAGTLRWLLAGGIVYTLGTLFYHRPRMPYAHAIWHLFVIGGGACHYVAVLRQVTN